MGTQYRLSSEAVVSEVIDGEAIIMDMAAGIYHSADGVAAQIWEATQSGTDRDTIVHGINLAYPGSDHASEVGAFLDMAVAAGLLVETETALANGTAYVFGGGVYSPPLLHSHGDMQDLIMLDPIHDVSEKHGWPVRMEPAGSTTTR
ncbi:PqqD family protein [Flavisphingomonas formosensis]|uniref:PqqD family protein n=1 Tax=Flavisphingomonas formosensis TaxID=861534 RepID=UPI0012FC8AA9|nr:PqqD family protein [Sphingomonas formosensis]